MEKESNVIYVKDFDNGIFIYDNVTYKVNAYYNYTRDQMIERIRNKLGLKNRHLVIKDGSNMITRKAVYIDD